MKNFNMGLQQDVGDVSVEDIRLERVGSSIRDEIYRQLQPGSGNEKRMPTMLLYDEKGLKLFEDLTYLEEYYLTNAEIRVLEHHAAQIAERIVPDSILLELGSGYVPRLSLVKQLFSPPRVLVILKDVESHVSDRKQKLA